MEKQKRSDEITPAAKIARNFFIADKKNSDSWSIRSSPPLELVDDIDELVLVGRSNVGKSKILNLLCSQSIAKVSASAGSTRRANYYLLKGNVRLIDLPGYGYASATRVISGQWPTLAKQVFVRPNLKIIMLLIDCRRGVVGLDEQFLDWLLVQQIQGITLVVVLTKIDKLKKQELTLQINKVANQLTKYSSLGACGIYPTSSLSHYKNLGIDPLRQELYRICTSV